MHSMTLTPHALLRALILLAAAVPILYTINLIAQHAVNVPLADALDADALIALDTAEGVLDFQFIWQPHNEHRIVTSKLAVVLLTWLTGYNVLAQNFLSVTVAVGSLALLLIGARRVGAPWLALTLPLSLLIFAPQQVENWLWAFQLCWFLTIFFALAAIVSLLTPTPRWRAFIAAAICAVLSHYSLSAGILIWPIGFVVLLLIEGWRKPQYLIAWVVIAAASIALYFIDLGLDSASGGGFNLSYFIGHVLSFLGNPFAEVGDRAGASYRLLALVGLVTLAVQALILRRRDGHWRSAVLWLAVAALAVGAASLTGLGRLSTQEIDMLRPPTSGRYITYGLLLWVGLAGMTITLWWKQIRGAADRLPVFDGAVSLTAAVVLVIAAALMLRAVNREMRGHIQHIHADCLRAYAITRDLGCAIYIHPAFFNPNWVGKLPTETVRAQLLERIDGLLEHRLATFSPDLGGVYSIPMHPIPFVVQNASGEVTFRESGINSFTSRETLAQALTAHATSWVDFTVTLPPTQGEITLETSGYIQFIENPDPAFERDGVEFRLEAIQNEQIAASSSVIVPPDAAVEQPITLDLTAFQGQTVTLRLGTFPNGNSNYDWALWVNPQIVYWDW